MPERDLNPDFEIRWCSALTVELSCPFLPQNHSSIDNYKIQSVISLACLAPIARLLPIQFDVVNYSFIYFIVSKHRE